MNSVRKALLVPVVALLVPTLVACGSSKDKSSEPDKKSSSSASATDSPSSSPTSSADGVVLHKDGFSITLPAEATSRTQTVPTAKGNLDVTLYISSDISNGATYVVAMTSYPKGATLDLDNAIKGAATNVNGTVKDTRTTEYLGNPTRDAVITANTQGQDVTVFGRFIQVGQKLFQLQCVVPKADLTEPPAGFTDVVNSVTFD